MKLVAPLRGMAVEQDLKNLKANKILKQVPVKAVQTCAAALCNLHTWLRICAHSSAEISAMFDSLQSKF